MRWRFLDRVDSFEPWVSLKGRKALSFEEYSLLKPFGDKGIMPASLALASCAAAARWLVTVSSNFEVSCILSEIDGFEVSKRPSMGDVLTINAVLMRKDESGLEVKCRGRVLEENILEGVLSFSSVPLAELNDPEVEILTWANLYAAT